MRRLIRTLTRIQQLIQQGDVRIASWLAFHKLVSPIAEVGIVHFFECDLRKGLPAVRPVPGIVAREAFLEDVALLDGTENASVRKADAVERLKNGERWFVGIDASNGKLTNYRFVAAGPTLIPELGANVVPGPGEVFIYALYTVPEYRRKGIDSFTRHYTYDLLHKTSGVNRVLATIFAGNYASFRASRQFLNEVGHVWYVSTKRTSTPRLFVRPRTGMPALVSLRSQEKPPACAVCNTRDAQGDSTTADG
jgi:hypothetical protein